VYTGLLHVGLVESVRHATIGEWKTLTGRLESEVSAYRKALGVRRVWKKVDPKKDI